MGLSPSNRHVAPGRPAEGGPAQERGPRRRPTARSAGMATRCQGKTRHLNGRIVCRTDSGHEIKSRSGRGRIDSSPILHRAHLPEHSARRNHAPAERIAGDKRRGGGAHGVDSGIDRCLQEGPEAIRRGSRIHGTLQMLAKRIDGGEMDLSLKSLKIVSKGKSLVSLGSVADSGGVIQLASSDGTSSAEISAAPGKSLIGLKAATGADPAHVVHVASYGAEGYTLQKGPSDDAAAKTDGAGLQILDEGADFYLAQSGGGNVSIGTSSADERAKLSIWSEGNPRKGIYLSLGTRDITPFVSVTGAASGDSLTLLPDRLSLANRDGTVVLAAAEDSDGGYVFVNDKAGSQRVLMTANADGKGTISVFGNDNRSNTLYPEYNIQKIGSTKR